MTSRVDLPKTAQTEQVTGQSSEWGSTVCLPGVYHH